MDIFLSNWMLSSGGKRVTDKDGWTAEQQRHWTQVTGNRDRKYLERTGQRSLSK